MKTIKSQTQYKTIADVPEYDPSPIINKHLPSIRITRNAKLDRLHEIRRYTRYYAKKAGRVAYRGLDALCTALDEAAYGRQTSN